MYSKYTFYICFLFCLFLILPAHAQDLAASTSSTIDVVTSTEVTTTTDETATSTEPVVYEVNTDRELIEEPNIRVGLKKTAEVVNFVSDQTYEIYSGGEYVDTLPLGEAAKLSYKKGKYFLKITIEIA